MNGAAFDVVWPLYKAHYLNVPAAGMVNMAAVDESPSPSNVVTPERELAARALHGGPDCSQQRVSDLLGVSRRTIGRMAEADLSKALCDPQVLEEARTCLADTASRGSTAEERAAALAWLEEAARDEHQVERAQTSRQPPARRPAPRSARRPSRPGVPRHVAATASRVTPAATLEPRRSNGSNGANGAVPFPPLDALRRQQQRILHRSALIDYVLAAEKRSGDPLRMGDALAELLADITEAAHTIGTLLQTTNGRP